MALIQPVILSGGAGTRLWPASRAMFPKQLLPLVSENTMLQDTALRLSSATGLAEHFLVVCNEAHRFMVAEQLHAANVPAKIMLEPEGRNTAPATALAALVALRIIDDRENAPLLLVMPADHVIQDNSAFLDAIETGKAEALDGKLVAFGVAPTEPNSGFGYIEVAACNQNASPIISFIEKPAMEIAQKLINSDRCFWNAGIFLFRADRYLAELERFAPGIVAACAEAVDKSTSDGDFIRPDSRSFLACPADYTDLNTGYLVSI